MSYESMLVEARRSRTWVRGVCGVHGGSDALLL